MAKLATNATEAIMNIERFGEAAGDLTDRLANARAWYATNVDGTWRFGPSKFIGYQGLEPDDYLQEAKNMDGRQTEAVLTAWFTPVEPGTKLHQTLMESLRAFLAEHGKRPSSAARISVLRSDLEAEDIGDYQPSEQLLVNLLAAVYRRLSQSEQRAFKELVL